MKLKNKILIVLLILALSICLAFISSAGEYDFISSYEFSAAFGPDDFCVYTLKELNYTDSNNNSVSLNMFILESHGPDVPNAWICYSIQPHAFQEFITVFTGLDSCTYSEFMNSLVIFLDSNLVDGMYNCDYFYIDWMLGNNNNSFLTESYYNKLYYNKDSLSYDDGVTEGIRVAHDYTLDWFTNNNIIYEPWGADGTLSSLEGLLADNIPSALARQYNAGYTAGYTYAEDKVYPLAYDDGVNASLTRLEDWLSGKNILYESFFKDGDLATINQILNNNVVRALDERQSLGYELGNVDGQALGKTEMYNQFIQNINSTFKTEYPLSDGATYDFAVLSNAYNVSYEAGELYQLNKLTDDGGISDFLADISGTILSTFFYLGTNISFMGTTALSLISLFVIAAIVIFILKFFNK